MVVSVKYFPLVLVFFTSVNCQSAFTRCRLRYPRDICYTMYSSLRDSLVADPRNIFELQQAFYPMGRFTSNVLLNVLYTVNLTEDVLFDLPTCDGVVNDPINTTQIILAGWSRSEIFNIISPIHLSELQLQISNAIYGLFVIPGSGIPLAESFGWKLHNSEREDVDLQYVNLIYINVSLDNVSCLPDETLLMSALQDITIMLKVWASTQGQIPEEIDEHNLGFPTEPGFRIKNVSQIIFTPFFAAMVAAVSCIFGFGTIIALGATMPNIYRYFSEERKQFKYYFFALAASLGFLNTLILALDAKDFPVRCTSVHFSYFFDRDVIGCSGIIITKITYFLFSITFSLVASLLSSRSSKILGFQNMKVKKCENLIYVLCCWPIILFLSLVAWAMPPTILMVIVYPNIILTLTVIMLASVFWLGVILTIPPIFFHNIRMNSQCINSFLYILPFAGLVLLLFTIGLITVTYINAVVFGSDVGGPIGLLLATIPSIFLTFFSEFYRDWFLTRTSNLIDNRQSVFKDGGDDHTNVQIEMEDRSKQNTNDDVTIVIKNTDSIEADQPTTRRPTITINEDKELRGSEVSGTIERRRHGGALRRKRRSTRLISTGEPPGFLHRQLRGITATRSRVYSTPNNPLQ